MTLWRCRACGCSFAVGLPYCPQCTSTDHEEDDGTMPKITKHGGPSDRYAADYAEPVTAEDTAEARVTTYPVDQPAEGPEPAAPPADEPVSTLPEGAPARNASKATWAEYLVGLGLGEAEAEARSRDDLIYTAEQLHADQWHVEDGLVYEGPAERTGPTEGLPPAAD
jgi:hypothetical protein